MNILAQVSIGFLTILVLTIRVKSEDAIPKPEIQNPMPMSEVISRNDDGPFDFEYREEIFAAADRYLGPRDLKARKVTILAWSLSYSAATVPPESMEELLLLVEGENGKASLIVLHRAHVGPQGWVVDYDALDDVILEIATPATLKTIRRFAASSGFWPSNNPDFAVVKIVICSKMAKGLEKAMPE